jgi:2-polyprenyl-6-methoxyphenol hydroxylase-like FAD-dependent oxidoreductase
MGNMTKTEVVIIGAGPTGLSLAAQMIRMDVDFMILDHKETTTTLSKAIVVHARTMEIFKELGIGEEAIRRGQIIHQLNLVRSGKANITINISNLGQGLSEFPFILSLEQSKTERLLYDFLQANKKDVLWNSDYAGMEQQPHKLIVSYRDKNGEIHKIEAKYIVGCDGAHSPVRHEMGKEFTGDTEPKLFYVADVLVKSDLITEKEFYFFMNQKTPAIFFGMEGENHYRIIGILPHTDDSDNTTYTFDDVAKELKKEMACKVEFPELKWFSTYKVSSRMVNSFGDGRAFICGDAAHIHTPAGGQGMNTGIGDGYNLAWKLALVLKGKLKPEVLDSYSLERTENARHLLKTTDRMFDLMAKDNLVWNFIREYVMPLMVKELSTTSMAKKTIFPLISQIGIAYPDSPLTISGSVHHVKAGDRMPFFMIGGKSVYDFLKEPCFKILSFGHHQIQTDFPAQHAVPLETYAFESVPEAIFGNQKSFHMLLRPDNHISYIGDDIQICFDFLRRL